jgi:hypothetical protein
MTFLWRGVLIKFNPPSRNRDFCIFLSFSFLALSFLTERKKTITYGQNPTCFSCADSPQEACGQSASIANRLLKSVFLYKIAAFCI